MNLNGIAPQGTFVSDYMHHMREQETASAYDFWCALWLLSVACGRDVVVARPRAPVYLNMYAVLVADSGITRKSSAVRHASSIARRVISDDPLIGMVENKATATRIDDVLHQRTMDVGAGQLVITASELAAFVGTGIGAGEVVPLLTDLYDCPDSRRGGGTISRGVIDQRNVWINFLAASTPEWLFKCVHPTMVAGGFTSRCYFIVSERPKARIAWPSEDKAADAGTEGDFVARLHDTRAKARRYREIILNDNALATFRKWYAGRQLHRDPFRSSFEAREDAHVLRVAALLCINDGAWIVQQKHVTDATRIIAGLKSSSAALFAGTGMRSKWIMGAEAIRDALIMAGGPMPRAALYLKARNHIDNSEFQALMDTMHESGFVERLEGREGLGRPVELYRGTTLLRTRGVIERLAEVIG